MPAPPLLRAYRLLFAHFGPQHWWPGRSRFEICVGAILTQNTSWDNVQRTIANLRRAKVLSPRALRALPLPRLAALIRSSGYFRIKARRLRAFVDFLWHDFGGDPRRLFRLPTPQARERLLSVYGVGPETADSMLLYAGSHTIFVVDAYTRRVMARHGWTPPDARYHELQRMFHRAFLRPSARFFNEYHALLVTVGKQFCRAAAPRCQRCPLRPLLPRDGARSLDK